MNKNIGAKVYTLSLNSAASMGDDDSNLEWIREGTEVVKASDYETALNLILKLEAERDKLRETLQEILDEHDSWFIHEAARKALKEQT